METPPHAASASGVRPENSRMYLVIQYVTWVGIVAHAGFIPLFWWLGVPFMAAFNVFSVAAWVGARVANQRGRHGLAIVLLYVEVVGHAVLAVGSLGWASGFHYYLIPVVPFLLFNDRLRTRDVIAASVLVVVTYMALRLMTHDLAPIALPQATLRALEVINILVPFAALGVMSIYFRRASIDVERRMEQLAMTDALTTLPNRRRMREVLEAESVRLARSRRSFGLLIGDLDGFKQINDGHGHEVGDQVLREVAAVLRSVVRAQDVVARWGGEEFLVLLPDTDAAGAAVVAEKLREAVERAVVASGSRRLRITMTFGVSSFGEGGSPASIEECIKQADRALYKGKDEGKNRVVMLERVA